LIKEDSLVIFKATAILKRVLVRKTVSSSGVEFVA
jgi:hypothetical protein